MLYVFFGTDTVRVRQAAIDAVTALREQLPNLETYTPECAAHAAGAWASAAATMSLFATPAAYVIDRASDYPDCYAELLRDTVALGESANHFIVIEGALTAADKKVFSKTAVTMAEYKADSAQRFNPFGLTDALARRDKRILWLLLQEAGRAGTSGEEVIGLLWWQLKSLRLAALTQSAAESGMKEFSYNKAKRALTYFKPGELEQLSRSLLVLYHDGHAGKRDLQLALEEWVLRI